MQQHLLHSLDRFLAIGLAAVSTTAMFYAGLYQSRALGTSGAQFSVRAVKQLPMRHSQDPLASQTDTLRWSSTWQWSCSFSVRSRNSGFGFRC